MAKGKYKRKRLLRERRNTLLQNSGLSMRVVHLLSEAGLHTLEDLDLCSEDRLKSIDGVGEKALEEIRAVKRMI